MSTMNSIQKLLSEGKTQKEIIEMGFARSTVYALAKKIKAKGTKKKFEVRVNFNISRLSFN